MELDYSPMTIEDLPEILRIERESFPNPWSRQMFERDILHNTLAHIFSVRMDGVIVGYFSIWKVVDEGHLVTLAVDPACRRKGLGERICRHALDLAVNLNIRKVTLEVRSGNRDAIRLYTKLGFIKAGVRMKYYEDGADAWIMDLDLAPPLTNEASA